MYEGKTPNIYFASIDKSILLNHPRYHPISEPVTTVKQLVELDESEYYRIVPYSEAWKLVRERSDEKITVTYGASSLNNLLGLFTPYVQKYFGKEGGSIHGFKDALFKNP